jgi:sn-glycerol 3-phosphate transport system permease protein
MSFAEPAALPVATSAAPRLHVLKRFSDRFKASLPAYLLLLPSLIFLALFTYGAMGRVFIDALYQRATPKAPVRFVGLDNISAVLADPAFTGAVANNLIYAVGTAIPSIGLALLFALALARTNAVTSALRAALFLPVLIPMVAASALFLFIFLPNVGLLDYYIGRFLPVLPNWLGDSDIALYAIMVITIWKNAGYYMLFFLAGLQSVPEDVMEAAHLDGAGPFQRLRYIILPELKPTFLFVTVIAILNAVTQVDHVFVMTKGGPSNATNLVLFYIYQQAVEHYDIGKASAATLLTLAALMGLTVLSPSARWRTVRAEHDSDRPPVQGRPARHPPRDHAEARLPVDGAARAGLADPVPVDGRGDAAPGVRRHQPDGRADAEPEADARQHQGCLGDRRFPALLPQHHHHLHRHPAGAIRHDHAGGLCVCAARLRRQVAALLFVPDAADAGAGAADRAEPAHRRAIRPLRHARRRHDAVLRLGLRHLPDAAGF